MPVDASERAFKIFTEAYGKAWAPQAHGLGLTEPAAESPEGSSDSGRIDKQDHVAPPSKTLPAVFPSRPL